MSYPVSLRISVTNAQLLYKSSPAEMRVETTRHGFTMKNHPIEMHLDNEGFFDSIGIKSLKRQAEDAIQKGKQAVSDFMSRKAEESNAALGPHGMTIAEVIAARFVKKPEEMTLTFIPDEKPEISWSGGYIDIDFQKDDVDISWTRGDVSFRYIPYSVEISVDRWSDDLGLSKK